MLTLLIALWAARVGPGPSDLDVGPVDRVASTCAVEIGSVPVLEAPAGPESWRGRRGLSAVAGDETSDETDGHLARETSPAHSAPPRTSATRGARPRPPRVLRRERSPILRC